MTETSQQNLHAALQGQLCGLSILPEACHLLRKPGQVQYKLYFADLGIGHQGILAAQ